MSSPPSALEIAQALIRFPSVTPADCGALPYLSDLLGKAGFAADLVSFEAPGTPAVLNLYARFGAVKPNLAFAGHTDVVPPGDKALWRFDPFSGEIADGELWGRGACDMKGGVAASVAAALRFINQLPHHRGRRRPGGQRHGQACRLGARQGRNVRALHPG
jgi:succinyl-diaminopimelate desuccinylase